LIDAGNSRLKAALYSNGQKIQFWEFLNENLSGAKHQIGNPEPDAILISSTHGNEEEIQSWFPGQKVFVLDHRQYSRIHWAYPNPGHMGKDRLAAIIGGSILYPEKNICVADSGTCLTLDFLKYGEKHLGGVISPGLKMRFQAMHQFTRKLPLVSENEMVDALGFTTETCMASGAVLGIVSEIEYHLQALEQKESEPFHLILTGGNAIFLAQRLKRSNFVAPDLVFQGMNAVLANLV
jgi:type III pantothenate kinase